MELYFDYKVNIKGGVTISRLEWHTQLPLLAVAMDSVQSVSTSVMILDQMGERVGDVNEFHQENNEVTSLSWHPAQRTLVVGLLTGDVRLWNGQSDFVALLSPHLSPIVCLKWSQLGSRLISADQSGKISCWKLDGRGSPVNIYQCELDSQPMSVEFCCSRPGMDISSLAKKAVAGDEKALDMFSAWRPRTSGFRPSFNTDNVNFYIATTSAKIYYMNEQFHENMVLHCSNNIHAMLHHRTKNILIVVLVGISVCHYATNPDGSLLSISKVKLNGVGGHSVFVWAANNLLACTTNSFSVRFLDVETGNSYTVSPTVKSSDNNDAAAAAITNTGVINDAPAEWFTSIAYVNKKGGVLCGGSNNGTVTIWKRPMDKGDYDQMEHWEQIAICKLKAGVVACAWGVTHIGVLTVDGLYMLQEHTLSAHYNKQVACVQTAASKVVVTNSDDVEVEVNTDLKIVGLAVSTEYLVLWSGKTIAVYQITDSTGLNVIGTFNCECEAAAIYDQNLIVLPNSNASGSSHQHSSTKILVYTLQGTIKQYLDCDGQPIALHLNNCYLVTATIAGMLQMWDFSRREAKVHAHPKDLVEAISDFGEVILLGINCAGNKIALTVANSHLIPQATLYIWDIETDSMQTFDFKSADHAISGRFITRHYWDANEATMLGCEIKATDDEIEERKYNKKNRGAADNRNRMKKSNGDLNFSPQFAKNVNMSATSTLVTLFVTTEHGIIQHDAIPVTETHVNLLGLDTPNFIALKKSQSYATVQMTKITLSNFEELTVTDDRTRNAVLKFSFFLSIGDLDNAFKTIHNIDSVSVWTSLAKMCVKTKRLDVAEICLGKMKDSRGVTALREVSAEEQIEVRIATLALHLGMLEEAENLYKNCGRYDLLNKMYQSVNRWDAALSMADKMDRIHLRNTYDNYGRYLESKQNISEAIRMYERADTHRFNVPRLLLNDPLQLQQYISKSKDPSLIKWWAQYTESTGNMELALKYYEEAKDYLSMVRILCFLEDVNRATKIAVSSGDTAACYHLARHYENLGQIEEAVNFFVKSKTYGNAIRICKEHGLDDQLWQLAVTARGRERLEAAEYFEQTDPYKAVLLYQKDGNIRRALAIAFKYGMLEAIRLISSNLDKTSDKELLEKCANFFLEKDEYEQAMHLFTLAAKYETAISLCTTHRINITEELAELLTPDPEDPNRMTVLNQLAEYALMQGNYHLATKKYTQAGNKENAMKALLKSGDTEKVIFFANVSRQRDIYVMAANYLQTLDWQSQPELLKHIVNFYIKSKAPHLLANFYVSCAQTEIDEYGNYEKGLSALNEASRCLNKNPDQYGLVLEQIARKITAVKRFLEIRRQLDNGEDDQAMTQCRNLLSNDELLDFVRKGDVYSLMIEQCTKNNDWNAANQLALEMKKALPNDNLGYYVPKGILTKLGLESTPQLQKQESIDDDIIDET